MSVLLYLGLHSHNHTTTDCLNWYFLTSYMTQILIISVIGDTFLSPIYFSSGLDVMDYVLNLMVTHSSYSLCDLISRV